MGIRIIEGATFGDARECIRAAKTSMRQVRDLLAYPSAENAEKSAGILRDVEVLLGCAAAMLKTAASGPDPEMRAALEDLQDQAAVLSRFFAQADQLLSGWLQGVQTRRGGYTDRGRAAPLIVMNKLRVEG